MSTTDELRRQVTYVQELTSWFVQELLACDIEQARVYQLPEQTKEEERLRALALKRKREAGDFSPLWPDSIAVTTIDGDEAWALTRAHFTNYYAKNGSSTRYVAKLPGFIIIKCQNPSAIVNRCTQLNQARMSLLEIIKQLDKSPDRRHEIVHAAFPGLMTPQVTRQIPLVANVDSSELIDAFKKPLDRVRSIGSHWEHRMVIEKPLSRADVLQRLSESQRQLEKQPELAKHIFIEREREAVLRHSDTTWFQVRRPGAVTPIMKINGRINQSANRYQFVGHTPVILLNTGTPQKVSDLDNYTSQEEADHQNNIPVIGRWHLYTKHLA